MTTPDPTVVLSAAGLEVRMAVGPTTFASIHSTPAAYRALMAHAPFETGFLPPHVVSIRTMGDHQQYVLCLPPSANTIIWVEREGAPECTYLLAQPYRVIIGDFVDGQFLGARLFYSPHPVTSFDAPLYHANVPNLNCRGYNDTSVGWVCLYPNEDTTAMSVAERIGYLGLKTSGNEAFNDENMSETDGPRFYADYDAPEFVWNPQAWEAKTLAEGVDWTLDPGLWLPVLVTDADDQDAHDSDGVPLTLAMAMTGYYKAYYPHRNPQADRLAPINAFARADAIDFATLAADVARAVRVTPASAQTTVTPPQPEVTVPFAHPVVTVQASQSALHHAHAAIEANAMALQPTPRCRSCQDTITGEGWTSPHNDDVYCEACWYDEFSHCGGCDQPFSNDDLVYYEHLGECWCQDCYYEHYSTECQDCDEYCVADDAGNYPFQRFDHDGHALGVWCDNCYEHALGTCNQCGVTEVVLHANKCALCTAQANTVYPACLACGATERPVYTVDPTHGVGCTACMAYTRCARCACNFHESVPMHKVPGLETDIGFCPNCIASVCVCHAPDCGAFGSHMYRAEDSDLTYCSDHLGTCAKCERVLARPFDARGWCTYCVNWEAQTLVPELATSTDAANHASVNSYYAEEAGEL